MLGDVYGEVIHLFERECSIQRRRQGHRRGSFSVYSEELCQQMCQAVVQRKGRFGMRGRERKFVQEMSSTLEMNTRLQVEHPVTEEIRALILHRQIGIAQGERLTIKQETGHRGIQ